MTNDLNDKEKITWGELKEALRKAGIKENDEIDRIDLGWGNPIRITIKHDEDFGWQIYL